MWWWSTSTYTCVICWQEWVTSPVIWRRRRRHLCLSSLTRRKTTTASSIVRGLSRLGAFNLPNICAAARGTFLWLARGLAWHVSSSKWTRLSVAYPELVSRGVSKSRKFKWLVKVGACKDVNPLIKKKSWPGGGGGFRATRKPPGYATGSASECCLWTFIQCGWPYLRAQQSANQWCSIWTPASFEAQQGLCELSTHVNCHEWECHIW